MGLDTVELIMWAEDEFNIEIPDNHAENIATVQQLSDYVFEKTMLKPTENKLSKKDLEEMIRRMLEELTGIPYDKIKMEHTFTYDLGMD